MRTAIAVWPGNRGMLRRLVVALPALLVLLGVPVAGWGANPTVTLTPSVASPQMVGTSVTWTAAVNNAPSGHTYSYQFSVTYKSQTQILGDFSPVATFTWVPSTVEGAYVFNVVARDITTTPYVLFAPVTAPFTLTPWVTAALAAGVVNPTSHPLVALFSGPPCAVGHQMLVRFRPAEATGSQNAASMTTNPVACSPNSVNLFIAGMYPSSQYLMHWEEYSGGVLVNSGSDLAFTTGALPASVSATTFTVTVPPQAYDAAYPVALFQTLATLPTATDLAGNVLWYAATNGGSLDRIEPGGTFYEFPFGNVALYDLAGHLVKTTNVEILNEQLAAKGYPIMTAFNTHEVRNLPDGNIGLFGQRTVVSTTAQGGTPSNPVTILGDMVLVLDNSLQLVWAWDSFAHEDINRIATLHDITSAAGNNGSAGANDWTHSNALQGTADGNILVSQRAQDMVLKIDYAKGTGDGHVIWRMGAGLDFTIANPPPTPAGVTCTGLNLIPWFTHQHDSAFQFEDDASGDGFMVLTVFDDGNTRHNQCSGTQNSRGMVLLVDEAARQLYIETQTDLGSYSPALGSAQLLTPGNGNTYATFDSGQVNGGAATQFSEVTLAGQIVDQMAVNQSAYRAYRMPNLYTPTEFEVNPPTGIVGALPPSEPFNFNSGFAQNQDALETNGNAAVSGNVLQLTDGGSNEAGTVFYGSPVNVQTFTTDFTFQETNAKADGFTFTIQNAGPTALGSLGGGLGYTHIGDSVAIKFDLYNNSGEGSDSTGLFVDGAAPTTPAINLGAINLHSADVMDAHLTYDGTTLTLTLTDLMTNATFTQPFTINIPSTVGGSTAYVGFTGGTGGESATQQILSWSYEPTLVPYEPTSFPSGTTSVALNGSAALTGATIELTNGGNDEAGSAFYASPVNVQSFTTDFDFQLTKATSDGFTFTIQGDGPTALGAVGGALGYKGIAKSVAVKFDLHSNAGEGIDSTGIFTNGASPTVPSIDLTGTGIDLHSGDMMHASLNYDGTALTLTITDLATNATWTQPFVVDIPSNVGGNTAYVGFTAGTGSTTAVQQILNWTFE
jgi:hypothetical protein